MKNRAALESVFQHLLAALANEEGVQSEVYEACYELCEYLHGKEAASYLGRFVDATDNNFYFQDGALEEFCRKMIELHFSNGVS